MLKRNPDPQGNPTKVCCQTSTIVKDRIQYAPNYDAKGQPGTESAMLKVWKKYSK